VRSSPDTCHLPDRVLRSRQIGGIEVVHVRDPDPSEERITAGIRSARPHPMQDGGSALDIFEGLPSISLEPVPIEVVGHDSELDNEVPGQVLRLAPRFSRQRRKRAWQSN
jgi:hypothetical protein